MVDVLLTSDDLTVLGGPSTVNVEVDFGPQGQRGSQVFVGNGNPNDPDTVIGQTPNVFDLYINLQASDTDYKHIFQYQAQPGGNTWVDIIDLSPNTFSDNDSITFTAGTGVFNVVVANVVSETLAASITSSEFNVQHNIENSNPVASSISIGSIFTNVEDGKRILPITIKASEYNGTAWSALTGSKTVHLFITVV